MKKRIKLFLAAAIAAIVSVAAGFYSYQATQENQLAQIELSALEANIEALTQGEGGGQPINLEFCNASGSFWSAAVICVEGTFTKPWTIDIPMGDIYLCSKEGGRTTFIPQSGYCYRPK